MNKAFWIPALLLLVFAGDRLAGHWLENQALHSRFRYARLYNGNAGAEILLLGNSRGLTFFQPKIEALTGQKTFNLSYNGMPMDLAGVLAQDYLERYPAPRRMVIDITLCDRLNDQLIAGFLPYSSRSRRLDSLIYNKLPEVWRGGRVSYLYRCNSEIFQRALYYHNRSDEDWLLDRVIAPQMAAEMPKHRYTLDIRPPLVQALADLVRKAQNKKVQVELVIGPYYPGFAPYVEGLDALKQAVEKASGLPVRDFSQALDDPSCFGDLQHPNKKGALLYLDLLHAKGVF